MIVVLDDNDEILNMMHQYLQSINKKHKIFGNTQEFIRFYTTNYSHVSTVICDYNLNDELNGEDVYKKLLTIKNCFNFVLMTGNILASQRLSQKYDFPIIKKPFKLSTLKEHLGTRKLS